MKDMSGKISAPMSRSLKIVLRWLLLSRRKMNVLDIHGNFLKVTETAITKVIQLERAYPQVYSDIFFEHGCLLKKTY